MIAPTRQELEARLDWIDSELEQLMDQITELKRERSRIADQLDGIIDEEDR